MANLAAELQQFLGTKTLRMWLGIVKPCDKKNAAKVVVPQFDFDEWLKAVSRNFTRHSRRKIVDTLSFPNLIYP